jgi:hypothetical protein
MGTTVTPDVDPDQIRTLDTAWHTFFDTTPNGVTSTTDKYHASGQSVKAAHREAMDAEDAELETLKKKRASIEERRTRLLQLHQLDDELEKVNLRIKNAESNGKKGKRTG